MVPRAHFVPRSHSAPWCLRAQPAPWCLSPILPHGAYGPSCPMVPMAYSEMKQLKYCYYLSLLKSAQSATGMGTLKPPAMGDTLQAFYDPAIYL